MKQACKNPAENLYLEPTYGLANRMRTIASGLELAQKTKRKVTLVWVNDFELNCSFDELFEPIEGVSIIIKPVLWQFTKNSKQSRFTTGLAVKLINKLMGFDYCIKEVNGDALRENGKWGVRSILDQHKSVYIQTCADFMDDDRMLNYLKPVPELHTQIDERIKNFRSNTIGLHIRRTDHSDAIKNSPLNLFVQHINKELEQDPAAHFYLSTDDPETVIFLKKLYTEKIIAYPKDFSRNSPQGIKDALIDLFCLANTRKIIGSFNSSFSNIASRINQIDLSIVTTKNSIVPKKTNKKFLSNYVTPKTEQIAMIRLTPQSIRVRY